MDGDEAPIIQARLRKFLLTAPALTRSLQAGRAVLHVGPWRHGVRAMIRWRRPPHYGTGSGVPALTDLDAPLLVERLRVDGIAEAGSLPFDRVARIRAVTDALPPGEYGDFQSQPDVGVLVRSASVLNVVRAYLGAEPVLLECNVVVGHAEDPASPTIDAQRRFHFDYAGWHSLNLFVYLTDVDPASGAHQVVAGTHRHTPLSDAVRVFLPAAEIEARYRNRIRTIVGAAGTMFFEDTTAVHRRRMFERRRVMLNVLYASHRSWLSAGRLVPKYSDYLRARSENASDTDRRC